MMDLHRHNEFSFYDGSGKAKELAEIAKEKKYSALGLTNHGNTSGNIQHYFACKQVGIKPIMGCEGYFLPKYKEKTRGFHLILIAKNIEGYKNLNIIQTLGDEQKFYNPIWTFDILKKYSDGLICSTACVASFSSQCILKNKVDLAEKYLKTLKEIFNDDLYIEVQPYTVSEKGMQEKVNIGMIDLSRKIGIKCILTSDSHRGRKDDIDAYVKMHQLKNQDEEYLKHIKLTYAERYMPDYDEMFNRFIKMHNKDYHDSTKGLANMMYNNLDEIEEKVDGDILDKIANMKSLPQFDKTKNSLSLLKEKVKAGLIAKNLWSKKLYRDRALEEINAAKKNNFEDYFLIVSDYVNYAKKNGIGVGAGRGSGCNCLINYALNITDVDSVKFGLNYQRFMREGKTSIPDIDVDFETNDREKIFDYLLKKYDGHVCRVASYGKFKVAVLVNDLIKTYPNYDVADAPQIKKIINQFISDFNAEINFDGLSSDETIRFYLTKYPNFLENFKFMYDKVKFLGTHAAGIIITDQSIFYYTSIRTDKNGRKFSAHDLLDLESIGAIKYDCLGLNTLTSLCELRKLAKNKKFDVNSLDDEKVLNAFKIGKSNGIFQFDSETPQKILKKVNVENFNDLVAVTAINRPGPLKLKMQDQYAKGKLEWARYQKKPPYANILNETYGCILYQEQVIEIATKFGGLSYADADKLRKMDDPMSPVCRALIEENYDKLLLQFEDGLLKFGIGKEESKALFDKFLNYTFNKGHAVGYTIISYEEMFYKVYYPKEFWFVKLNQADFDQDGSRLMAEAVSDGTLIFLPHVNFSADFSLRMIEGERVIQQGLRTLKGVGEKAANFIQIEREKNGIFKSYDDFIYRCKVKGSPVNKRVIDVLIEQGALEFNKKIYIDRVKKFNTTLYVRGKK